MHNLRMLPIATLLLVAGCPKSELALRVDYLEKQVATLTEALNTQKEAAAQAEVVVPDRPSEPTETEEEEARALFEQISNALSDFDAEQARTLMQALETKYANTRVIRYAERIKAELAIVGKEAGDLKVASWYQGSAKMDDEDVTVLVFWEKWCPHCQREMPKLEATHRAFKGKGLNLVALTKASRGVVDDDITDYLKDNSISFPVGKEQNASMSAHFGVRGVPAAAIIQDGIVIWRGHPARITETMLEKALE